MPYEVFFVGVGGTVLGALLGAWISSRLTFNFQKRLLQQQLDFQKAQADADAEFRKKMHEEQLKVFREFRDMLNTRFAHLPSSLSSALESRPREQS
jgi:hypothetical protein